MGTIAFRGANPYLQRSRCIFGGFPGGSAGKESVCDAETWVPSLGWEDPLEKGKATHSSILAWRIPWTTVHGSRSRTLQSDFHFQVHFLVVQAITNLPAMWETQV